MGIIEDGVKRGATDVVEIGTVYLIFKLFKQKPLFIITILIPVVCIIIWLIGGSLKEDAKKEIAKRSMYNAVQTGDSIFISKAALFDTTNVVKIYQLYRSETVDDINKMKIPAWKKKKLLDTRDTVENLFLEWVYSYNTDDIYKKQKTYLGTVLGKDSTLAFDDVLKKDRFLLEINPVKKVYNNMLKTDLMDHNIYPVKRFYISSMDVDTVDYFKLKKK